MWLMQMAAVAESTLSAILFTSKPSGSSSTPTSRTSQPVSSAMRCQG